MGGGKNVENKITETMNQSSELDRFVSKENLSSAHISQLSQYPAVVLIQI